MMQRLATFLAMAGLACGQDARRAEPGAGSDKTLSATEQFVVYGADLVMRGAIVSLAERQRERLDREVGEAGEWEHPIVIQLYGAVHGEAPPRLLKTRVFEAGGGFRLQIDAHLARGKPPGLERALLKMLLVERGLREREPQAVDRELQIAPWLLDGLMEAMAWREGERDRELHAALFANDQLFPVERLLEVEAPGEMDSVTRAAYRASAGALVMALLGQEGGRAAMRGLLGEAVTFVGDEQALLLKHFPGMNLGEKSLEKWWALQLAKMSEPQVTRAMDILDTEAELERLLVVRFKDGSGTVHGIPADSFRDLLAIPRREREEAIKPVFDALGVFRFRAFPAHRPIIMSYLRILSEAAAGRDRDLDARLASLAAEREDLRALGVRTRDFLDWYRITSAEELSGAFEDYIGLQESLRAGQRRKPVTGPISEYLDDVQALYGENE